MADSKLDQFRARWPDYDDVTDEVLVDHLNKRHYPDTDPALFRNIMGLDVYTREGERGTEIVRPYDPFKQREGIADPRFFDVETIMSDKLKADLDSALGEEPEAAAPADPMEVLRDHAARNRQADTLVETPEGLASLRSGSVNHGMLNNGRTTLIPFQWDGVIVDQQEAERRAIESGKRWPSFDSIDQATAASKALSDSLPTGRAPGYFSNIGRRVGERGAGLMGDLLTTTENLMAPAGRAGDIFMLELLNAPSLERDVAVNYARTRQTFFGVLGEHLKDVDFGSIDNYGKEKIEEAWDKGEYLGVLGETFRWGIEEGGASVPDMIGVIYAMPSYITARSGEMGLERARNEGREVATTLDILKAVPFAIGSALAEKLGTKYMLKVMEKAGMTFKKDAVETAEDIGRSLLQRAWQTVKQAGKSAGMEGFTEAVQEGVFEYLGETWGTDAELSARKAAIRGFWGALAGSVFGGTAGGLSGAAKEAGHAVSAMDAVPQEFLGDPDMRPDPDGPKPDPPTRPGEPPPAPPPRDDVELGEQFEQANADVARLEDEVASLAQAADRIDPTDREAIVEAYRLLAVAEHDLRAAQDSQKQIEDEIDARKYGPPIEPPPPIDIAVSDMPQEQLTSLWQETKDAFDAAIASGDVETANALNTELDLLATEIERRGAAPGELEPPSAYPPPAYTPTTPEETALELLRKELVKTERTVRLIREQYQSLTDAERERVGVENLARLEAAFKRLEEERANYEAARVEVEQRRADRPGRPVDDALAADLMDVLRTIRGFGPDVTIPVNDAEMAVMVARAQAGEDLMEIAASFYRGEIEVEAPVGIDEAELAAIEAEDEAVREEAREKLGPEFRAYEAATRAAQDLVEPLREKYAEWERFDYDERIGEQLDKLKEEFDAAFEERLRLRDIWTAASPVVRTSFAGTYEMAGQEFEFENALDVNPRTMQLLIERMSEAGISPAGRNAGGDPIYTRQDFYKYAEENGYDGIIFHGWPEVDAEIADDMGFDEELMSESVDTIAAEIAPPTPPTDIIGRDWQYVDPRMKRSYFRDLLEGFKEEFQSGKGVGSIIRDPNTGEVIGRIQSPNVPWVQAVLADTGMTVDQVHNAIDKALAGQRLGSRQETLVKGLLEKISEERQAKWLDKRRDELKTERDRRRSFGGEEAWLIEDEFYENLGENFPEEHYWGMDDEARIINDLAYRLVELGLDPDPILQRSKSDDELVRRLEEALYDYEAGTRDLAEDEREQAGRPETGLEAPTQEAAPFRLDAGWRVEGLAPDQIYGDPEAAYPIFGPAGYYFFTEAAAGKFAEDPIRDYPEARPEITSEPVLILHPYRIKNDDQYKALVTASGWTGPPNPMLHEGTPEERLAHYQAFAKAIREYLALMGFDGVVLNWDDAALGDVDLLGNPIKLLRRIFDTPQMIVFARPTREPDAGPDELVGPDDLAGFRGARITHEGVLAEFTGSTRVVEGQVQYEVLFLEGGRADSTAFLTGDPMALIRAEQALQDRLIELEDARTGGITDVSDTPLFGLDQADIFDIEGVETPAMDRVRRRAQVMLRSDRAMQTMGEQTGEEFLPIEDDFLDEFIQRMDEEFDGDLGEALADFYEMVSDEVRLIEAIVSGIDVTGERRRDLERRDAIDAMTPEEKAASIHIDQLTGLGNKRLLNENIANAPFVLSLDVDNLQAVNNELGREAGDKLLQTMADVIKRYTNEGFHLVGNKFAILGEDNLQLEQMAVEIEKDLAEAAVASERGELRGLKASWGVGGSLQAADMFTQMAKTANLERGIRVASGVVPPNLTLAGTTDPEIDSATDPMATPGDNFVPQIGKTGELPLDQDNKYVLSDGRRVRIPRKPMRRQHIIRKMKDIFGIQIYTGRVKGKSWLGFYRKGIGEIRTKFLNDLEVTAHEVGHWFDDRFNFEALYEPFAEELNNISYDSSKTNEGFAEFMRLWFTQEHAAIEGAPLFFDVFIKHLEAMEDSDVASDREMAASMRDVQEMMHAWYLQGALKRLDSKIGDPNLPWSIRWQEFRIKAADYVIQKILDQLRTFKQIERQLGGDFYTSFRKAKASNELARAMLEKGTIIADEDGDFIFTGESLKDVFDVVSDNMKNFVRYMAARRGRELMKPTKEFPKGREKLLRPDEIRAGLALGVADSRFAEVFDAYQAWNSRMMDFYVQSGIVSESSRQKMEAMNHDYVPFNRIIDALDPKKKVQHGRHGTPFMRLRGGSANLNDLLENITANTGFMVHMSLVNRAKQGLYDAIDGSQNQGGAMWATQIPKDVKSTMIPSEQVMRAIVNGFGLNMREWRAMSTMPADEIEAEMVARINEAFDTLEPFVQFWQVGVNPTGDVDFVFRAGEKVFYEIADPLMMDSLNHVGPQSHNLAVQILGGFSNVMRRSVTMWPQFQIRNFIRDTFQAWSLSRGNLMPITPAVQALFERFHNDEHYWEYIINGGGMASIAQAEGINADKVIDFTAPVRGVWQNIQRMWRFYDRALSTMEYANRIAEYKGLRKKGKSRQFAAFAGREISTDFLMRGSSETMRVITISIPFLNARMQGGYRLAREVWEKPPGERVGHWRRASIQYAIRSMSGVTMPSVVLYFMNKDDERYLDMPDWMRDLNWVFFYGIGPEDYVLIPKPFETGLIWATLPERIIELMYKHDMKEFGDAMGWMFMETFALDARFQAIKPIAELAVNKKWTGAPVTPRDLIGVKPSERYRHYTSDAMVALGKKLNVSPLAAEHIVRGYTTQLGQYLLAVADFTVGDMTNGGVKIAPPGRTEDDKAIFEIWGREFYADMPKEILNSIFLESLTDRGPLRRTRSSEDFYDLLNAARETVNTVAKMKLRDEDAALEYIARGREATLFRIAPTLEERSSRINEVNARITAMAVRSDITGVQKRDQINNLMRLKNQMQKTTMEQFGVEDLKQLDALMNERAGGEAPLVVPGTP